MFTAEPEVRHYSAAPKTGPRFFGIFVYVEQPNSKSMVLPLNSIAHKSDRLTDDEFYAFCQMNSVLRLERDETGQIWFRVLRYTKISMLVASLAGELGIWNRGIKIKIGYVYDSSAGFTLPDTSVRAPDVSWISRERWDALPTDEQDKFAQICPDFVIELMSDRDEKYTLPAKMEKYLQNGVRLGWAIDPFKQQTTVYRLNAEPETKSFTEIITGEDVLIGFELRLSDLL